MPIDAGDKVTNILVSTSHCPNGTEVTCTSFRRSEKIT